MLVEQIVHRGMRPRSAITREIAAADIAAVFQRYGIDLIAERIESEDAVLEILDLDVPYGQGHLFGAPRAIKESLMEETAPPREFYLKQRARERRSDAAAIANARCAALLRSVSHHLSANCHDQTHRHHRRLRRGQDHDRASVGAAAWRGRGGDRGRRLLSLRLNHAGLRSSNLQFRRARARKNTRCCARTSRWPRAARRSTSRSTISSRTARTPHVERIVHADYVIVEGIHLLAAPELRALFDLSVFMRRGRSAAARPAHDPRR